MTISPMSQPVPSWRCVLLIVMATACVHQDSVMQHVCGDLTVGYDIEIGDLASKEAEANAVAKLSNGQYQEAWWKLADAGWHDSAIHRFFDAGPLLPHDMDQLEKATGGSDSWRGVTNASNGSSDLIRALQRLSTGTYQMNKEITGTGKINASLWTLLFMCVDASSCNEGYFMPMVAYNPNITDPDHQSQYYSYGTVWLNLTTNLIANGIPYFIQELPPPKPLNIDGDNDSGLSITMNVLHGVRQCDSAVSLMAYRSILDASYGLVPGSACIQFNSSADVQFHLLVFLGLSSINSTWPKNLSTLEDFISSSLKVNNTATAHAARPFQECSEAPIMQSFQDIPNSTIQMCDRSSNICTVSDAPVAHVECSGVEYLRFLQSVTGLSKSCTYTRESTGKNRSLDADLVSWPPGFVSCNACSAMVDFFEFQPLPVFSPQSNWTSTEGRITTEFSQAPHTDSFTTCVREIAVFHYDDTSRAALRKAIQMRATTYLYRFIAEHNVAFTMSKGPATSLASFLALIVSTAIAVILGISGPFTNFLLRQVCKWRPPHLDSRRGEVRKGVKLLFQMGCNVMLSLCTFLPVMYLAYSERDREKPFETWDLDSSDQFIYSVIGDDVQLRVVYLLSATSKYTSHSIVLSAVVVVSSCALVAVCTAWRCKEVFDRYTLLQKYDRIPTHNYDTIAETEEPRAKLLDRAMRAIDMTGAEHLNIEAKVNAHPQTVQLQPRGGKGANATTTSAGTIDVHAQESQESILLRNDCPRLV